MNIFDKSYLAKFYLERIIDQTSDLIFRDKGNPSGAKLINTSFKIGYQGLLNDEIIEVNFNEISSSITKLQDSALIALKNVKKENIFDLYSFVRSNEYKKDLTYLISAVNILVVAKTTGQENYALPVFSNNKNNLNISPGGYKGKEQVLFKADLVIGDDFYPTPVTPAMSTKKIVQENNKELFFIDWETKDKVNLTNLFPELTDPKNTKKCFKSIENFIENYTSEILKIKKDYFNY